MGNNVEYVWVRPFTRDGEDFKGRLVNDARMRPDLKYGQTIAFDETNIAEWSYLDNTGMRQVRRTSGKPSRNNTD